jgi:hypothetical protein
MYRDKRRRSVGRNSPCLTFIIIIHSGHVNLQEKHINCFYFLNTTIPSGGMVMRSECPRW